jgi:hypothetical protein
MRRPDETRSLHLVCLLLACALPACRFNPTVPDGVVTCTDDGDCPAGLGCRGSSPSLPGLCCRGDSCAPAAGPAPPGGAADAGGRPAPPTSDASFGGGDAEITRPPVTPATGPAAPADGGSIDTAPGDAGATAAITCSSGADLPPTPAADRRTTCTFDLGDRYLVLGIDVITADDPVSTRSHAVCWTEPRLRAATQDPVGATRALDGAALDDLVAAVRQLQQRCTMIKGQPVGAVAGSWARQVPNLTAIRSRLRQDTGLDLEVPSEVQELAYRYLGVTRNRRGRIVFSDRSSQADVMYWPATASAPTRYLVPLSAEQAAAQYFSNAGYASFGGARAALHDRLQDQMRPLTADLQRLVLAGTLQPGLSIGPTDPTVLLAVKGTLRDPLRGWDPPDSYRRKLGEATVTTSAYGRAYGLMLPGDLDGFFPSIGARDFDQLRSEPIRAAYGAHVMLTVTLLDLLADETRLTELAFVFSNPHFGFLFSKLPPPPP